MPSLGASFPEHLLASREVADAAAAGFKVLTASATLSAADHGMCFGVGTDALTFTLPATVAGLEFRFVNTGADGNNIITISPNAADGVYGTITLASSVVDLGGAANKDLINTKATSIRGDSVHLIGDGVDGWYVLNSTGIWAAEA